MSLTEKRNRIGTALVSLGLMILLGLFSGSLGIFVAIPQVLLLVVAGFAVGPIFGEMTGKQAGTHYLGTKRRDNVPHLSEAESYAKRQEYARAAELYREAQEQFPDYLQIYPPLFDILVNRLHDYDTAREVYRSGWKASTRENRKKLELLFSQFKKSDL